MTNCFKNTQNKVYINTEYKRFPQNIICHGPCWLIVKGFILMTCFKISIKQYTDVKLKFDFVSVKMTKSSWIIDLLLMRDCKISFLCLLGNMFKCLNGKHSVSYQNFFLYFMLNLS